MTGLVTVITPSLPERDDFRADTISTVNNQQPSYDGHPYVACHLIGIDHDRAGVATMLNKLWPLATTEWVAVVADDDLLDDDYFRSLFALMSWGTSSDGKLGAAAYDVYYAYCRVVGRPGWNPNQPFDAEALRVENYIPATAIIRRTLIERLGGWDDTYRWEDWDFWLRALDMGSRFRCLQQAKWTYRFHGSNLSWPHTPTQVVAAV